MVTIQTFCRAHHEQTQSYEQSPQQRAFLVGWLVMVHARQKGKRGEKDVAKLCKEWWSQLEPSAEFVSTPGSGGFMGSGQIARAVRGGMLLTGDLMTTAKRFPFDVEVKHRESLKLHHIDEPPKGELWDWWVQCARGAFDSKRTPMLWFKRNLMKWHVMMEHQLVAQLPSVLYPTFAEFTEHHDDRTRMIKRELKKNPNAGASFFSLPIVAMSWSRSQRLKFNEMGYPPVLVRASDVLRWHPQAFALPESR